MNQNLTFLKIKPPEGANFNEKTFEKFLIAILKLLKNKKKSQNLISFELIFRNNNLNFFIVCHKAVLPIIKSQIYNLFPQSNVEETEDPTSGLEKKRSYMTSAKVSKKQKVTYKQLSSPIITGLLSYIKENKLADCVYQVIVRPVKIGFFKLLSQKFLTI
jgi:hypothetical protein